MAAGAVQRTSGELVLDAPGTPSIRSQLNRDSYRLGRSASNNLPFSGRSKSVARAPRFRAHGRRLDHTRPRQPKYRDANEPAAWGVGSRGKRARGHGALDELLSLIPDLTVHAVKASRGALITLESDGQLKPRAVRGETLRINTEIRDPVIGDRKWLLFPDTSADLDFAV